MSPYLREQKSDKLIKMTSLYSLTVMMNIIGIIIIRVVIFFATITFLPPRPTDFPRLPLLAWEGKD